MRLVLQTFVMNPVRVSVLIKICQHDPIFCNSEFIMSFLRNSLLNILKIELAAFAIAKINMIAIAVLLINVNSNISEIYKI